MKVVDGIRGDKRNPIFRRVLMASVLVVGILLQAQNSKKNEPPKSETSTAQSALKLLPPLQLDDEAALHHLNQAISCTARRQQAYPQSDFPATPSTRTTRNTSLPT